jgi:ComF family protein
MWRSVVEGVLKLGFRSHCSLCQRWAAEAFCPDCLQQLRVCQVNSSSATVLAWGNYVGTLKRAIALLKYNGKAEIARPLGQWLAQTWLQQGLPQSYVVVPIPLHSERLSQRGYNQAELIARSFCQVTGLKLRSQALIRCQATQAQFGLTIAERQRNLAHAFALGPDFQRQRPKWPVLLLDDIYTTGATAQASTQVLQQAGIKVHGTVAVAQAQRFNQTQ